MAAKSKLASASPDPEIVAMGAVGAALDALDDDARARVLDWATSRYGIATKPLGPVVARHKPSDAEGGAMGPRNTLGEFIAGLAAETDGDRALAAAAFVTDRDGTDGFASSVINSELKHMGFPAANITRTLDRLMQCRPQLIVQVRKSGVSRQARKLYKITDAGRQEIERMRRRDA